MKSPQIALLHAAKPKPEQAAPAVLEAFRASPEMLSGVDLFSLARPVVVFNKIEIKSVKTKGDQGKIEVRISWLVAIEDGQARLKKEQDTQVWALRRRDRETWEIALPQDILYVPQAAAVPMMANRLALLSIGPGLNRSQQIQLAQMLAVLTQSAGDDAHQ